MNTEKNYDFLLKEVGQVDHDYFLHDYSPSNGEKYYCAQLFKKQKLKASIYFQFQENGEMTSLKEAPFGGFWVEKKISSESFQFFVEQLLIAIRGLGGRSLEITQAPDPYQPQNPMIHYILNTLGFKMKKMLMHQVFENRKEIKQYLQEKASKNKKKQEKFNLDVEVGPIKNFNFLKDIKWWRTIRDHEYKVDEEKLIQQVSAYPDRYHLVTVEEGGEAVAHVLCVQLTSNSLYYFLPAMNPNNQQTFTGEVAIYSVIQLGDRLGVDFIDLGSSEWQGSANHSLIHFKSKVANNSSNKLTWQIQL
ncbi:GNAT family N-acetyltransferase [Echinicola jeungdonensis]|uniref:GNAT family N-acetyltransferase n=1 Tax=Echinicola jeungdonensis TaxID=709343 RepID=A0ABV5J4H4_9BACT|nr:GNAT family N-acetyltransferase [Echinicola jeungdonensis]MDN3667927.1 GNAT family N-acetyltransferase [Echinicola jeungdonensis]